jgi:simple sugar transport system ATP-binding protein
MAVAQRAVVLRAGRKVAEVAIAGSSAAELARHMVGASVEGLERQPPRPRADGQAPRLRVQGLHARHPHDRVALADVNLDIAPGEVLGIAGVSGNGQGLLARVLGGVVPPSAGQITLDGEPLAHNARGVVAQRVARVPEDRQSVGVVGDLPVWENLAAEALSTPVFSRWGWIRRGAALAYAQRGLQAFDVRGATLARRTRALSGGNMQKLILARVLQRADGQTPRLIVAHQPTWGLDIGAVGFVHRQLRAACAAGAAVLLISDDLDEIELLADRIAVICHGRLTPARPADGWTREQLGLAMAGTGTSSDTVQELPHAA